MSEMKEYPGLDLFKFICALLVLMLHANPLGNGTFGGIIIREIITPVAVPFFFMASGFLWFLSYINCGKKNAKNKIIRVLKMYCYWSLIYFPFVVIQWIINGDFKIDSLCYYLKRCVFEGSYQTIWYLNALWLALSIMLLLLKYFNTKEILLMSIPFYVLGCLLSSWRGLLLNLPYGPILSEQYYSFFETTKNGILFGFVYVSMGCYLANLDKNAKKDFKYNTTKIIGMAFVSIMLILGEWLIRTNHYGMASKSCDLTLSLLPVTYMWGG